MNYKLLKRIMDNFFEKTTTEELKQKLDEAAMERKQKNCVACDMLARGVKFRKSPTHTCGK